MSSDLSILNIDNVEHIQRSDIINYLLFFSLFLLDISVKLHTLTGHREIVSLYRVGVMYPWHRWQHDSCTCYLLGFALHLLHRIPSLHQYSIRLMNLRVRDTVKYVTSVCTHKFCIVSTKTNNDI